MKTTIPDTIATPEKAKAFFLALEQNGELFHIDDDATTIDIFTKEEGTRLNELLEEAFEALGQHELWAQMPQTNGERQAVADTLKRVNRHINFADVVSYLNYKDVDYLSWSHLEMLIYYIENCNGVQIPE